MILYRNRIILIKDNLYIVSGKGYVTEYLAKKAIDLSFIHLQNSIVK